MRIRSVRAPAPPVKEIAGLRPKLDEGMVAAVKSARENLDELKAEEAKRLAGKQAEENKADVASKAHLFDDGKGGSAIANLFDEEGENFASLERKAGRRGKRRV